MPGPVPSNRKLRRVAERTGPRASYPEARLYKLLARKYEAKGLRGSLQEDAAGALRDAYRVDNRQKRRKAVRRAWRGKY